MPTLPQRILHRIGLATRTEVVELERAVSFAVRRAQGGPFASGVPMTWGQYETEFNKKLKGTERWKTLDKMEADPHVKGALRSQTLPLLTAEWEIQPASDDERDIEIADFVAANLLRETNDHYGREYWIQTPWKSQRLPEILQFLRDGFSVFRKSVRKVGSKVVYDRLQWIEPSTVNRWLLAEDDTLIGIQRTYDKQVSGGLSKTREYDEFVPADELVLYTWDMKGARYNGRSAIRSMYGAWFRKDFIQRVAAIWAQKVGAPVPVGVYPRGWSDDQVQRFEEFIQSLLGQAPAEAWGAFEKGQDGDTPEIRYVGSETGEIDRSTSLVGSENLELSHALGTKVQMLGETTSGSRALGDSVGMVDMINVEAIAEHIAEQALHGVGSVQGEIEWLVRTNYANVQKDPKFVCPKLNVFERMEVVTSLVIPAVAAGLIPKHPDLRRQITDMAGFSLPDDAFEDEEVPPPLVEQAGVTSGAVPGGGGDTNGEEQQQGRPMPVAAALEARDAFRQRIADLLMPSEEGAPVGGGFRPPTRLEARVVKLAEVDRTMRVGQDDAHTVLRDVRARMTRELLARLKSGKVTARSVGSQRRSKFRGETSAVRELSAVLRRTGETGARHVRDELQRQRGMG